MCRTIFLIACSSPRWDGSPRQGDRPGPPKSSALRRTPVVLHVYFRQPFVLDEASGLRDAGAIVAGFGMSDRALLDVLSGRVAPQGRMPFALAGTRRAAEEQYSDLPGYRETTDGELFPFGHGSAY
jgi:beta-glucosidase